MPNIRSSADLRNNYNDISSFCHQYSEPVFITKNGKGDLAVMSIETYEKLVGRFELYGLLQDGLQDVREGKTRPFSEAIADIRAKRQRGATTSTLPGRRSRIFLRRRITLNSLSATPSPLTSCWMKLRRKSMLSLISQSNLSLLTILF